MSLRTLLKAAHGLGSAREGVAHWWAQRLTALILIPLALWFTASLWRLFRAERADLIDWFSSPVDATLMVLLIGATFYHAQLGLQVVVEDYVHTRWVVNALKISLVLGCWALGAVCAVSVLILALKG